MLRVAHRAWQKNDSATALGLFATAAKQRPTEAAPYLEIGKILRKTGRADEAISIYQRVLAFDGNNIAAYHGIGFSHLQMEKPYLASQSFMRSLEIDGDNAKSLGGLAVALDKAGDHEKAQSYYQQAIKADPDNLNYQSNLALSLALSGKTEQAIAILKVVTQHPNATAKHRQTMALAYGLAGKSAEAMKYSRMDLSEEDARNNALYFDALNSKADEQVASLDDQIKLMKASQDKVVTEAREESAMPRMPENPDVLVARLENEQLSTNARTNSKPVPAQADPKSLVPAPTAPMMIAQSETPTKKAAPVKDITPVVVTKKSAPVLEEKPVVITKKEVVEPEDKPVTLTKKEPDAPTEKPVTFVKKEAIAPVDVEKPETVAKAEVPAREWTLDAKPELVSKKSEPVVSDSVIAEVSADDVTAIEKVGLTPGNMSTNGDLKAYTPDGGNYFLQIGSYKEKADADKGWKIVQTQNVDLLGEIDPIIQEIDLGEEKGGLFYRLKIGGFSDKVRMMQLCGSLRDRNFDCFIPMTPKVKAPTKEDSAPTLAPNQRIAEDGDVTKPVISDDTNNMTADFEEGFSAL
nr:SPOR domain-containing protein [Sneathiella litorea]